MTSYFGPLEDVAFGIGDKFDYDKFKLWIERQQLNFSKSISIGGDIVSANWNGASPLNLANRDTVATAGFALDSSEGAMQFMGKLFAGGDIFLLPTGALSTNSNPGVGTRWIEYRGNDSGGIIGLRRLAGPVDLVVGQINVHNDGWEVATGRWLIGDGTEGLPSLSFGLDLDTGIYRISANSFGFVVGGTRLFSLSPIDNQVLFNNGTTSRPIIANSGRTAGLHWPDDFHLQISAGGVEAARFHGANTYLTGARNNTTGSAANTLIQAADGRIFRSTSSLKYKSGWKYVSEDELAKLNLPVPITWEDEIGGTMLGFGTEHIHEVLPTATQDEDDEGNPENYDVRALVAILSAKVKRLEAAMPPGLNR